jgi:hypothetical protein
MVTLRPIPLSPPVNSTPFRVSTRAISLDFSSVGTELPPQELGAVSASALRSMLERFSNLDAIKLVHADPQLIVTAPRGEFIVRSSNGTLLVRSADNAHEPFVSFSPADFLVFAETNATPPPPLTPTRKFQTLVGAASARLPVLPDPKNIVPSVPIYGAFRTPTVPPPEFKVPLSSPSASARASTPPPSTRRASVFVVVSVVLLAGAGALWFFFGRSSPPPPPPAGVTAAFEVIRSPEQLASLQRSVVGTYATNGEGTDRILEIRADGTFHFQEFGSSVALTSNRTGSYTFAVRSGTTNAVLRTQALGTVEIRDDRHLFCQQTLFTRLP